MRLEIFNVLGLQQIKDTTYKIFNSFADLISLNLRIPRGGPIDQEDGGGPPCAAPDRVYTGEAAASSWMRISGRESWRSTSSMKDCTIS